MGPGAAVVEGNRWTPRAVDSPNVPAISPMPVAGDGGTGPAARATLRNRPDLPAECGRIWSAAPCGESPGLPDVYETQ